MLKKIFWIGKKKLTALFFEDVKEKLIWENEWDYFFIMIRCCYITVHWIYIYIYIYICTEI